jgi:hypothetical protein
MTHDTLDRRGFLKCMASDFTFVQISDSHIGFSNSPQSLAIVDAQLAEVAK